MKVDRKADTMTISNPCADAGNDVEKYIRKNIYCIYVEYVVGNMCQLRTVICVHIGKHLGISKYTYEEYI